MKGWNDQDDEGASGPSLEAFHRQEEREGASREKSLGLEKDRRSETRGAPDRVRKSYAST